MLYFIVYLLSCGCYCSVSSLPRGAVGWSVVLIVAFSGHNDHDHCRSTSSYIGGDNIVCETPPHFSP